MVLLLLQPWTFVCSCVRLLVGLVGAVKIIIDDDHRVFGNMQQRVHNVAEINGASPPPAANIQGGPKSK